MSGRILVTVITRNNKNSKFKIISDVFSDPIFDVVKYKDESGNPHMEIIAEAHKYNPNIPSIIIRDTSVSLVSPTDMRNIVSLVNTEVYDIFYMSTWNDACQMYTKVKEYKGATIINSKLPYGSQALMFSPKGRSLLLGLNPMKDGKIFNMDKDLDDKLSEEIYNGNITALATDINLFTYDIMDNARENSDFSKVNKCANVRVSEDTEISNSNGLLWFVVIIVLTLIIAWAVIKIGPS